MVQWVDGGGCGGQIGKLREEEEQKKDEKGLK